MTDAVPDQAKGNPQKVNPTILAGQIVRRHLPYGSYPDWYDLRARGLGRQAGAC
ncbi:hypothetical protein AB0E08_48430 [Streptomyces sp. NPDC048281]|uniref:hypothetical protein n=1 Tax=Streptomyces sp. NPDC048281 TaxID=3154715 RepID=UPI00343E8A27